MAHVGGCWDLGFVTVVPGDRTSEFFESLAESAASLGEAFGPEEQERDDQEDDQVAGLEDSGEHDVSLAWADRPGLF